MCLMTRNLVTRSCDLYITYICNPFINIYKTIAEQIQSFAINTIEEIYIILNSLIKLFLELKADHYQNNLPIINKIAIIILYKYN